MEMHEYCMSYGIESHVFCMNKSDADNNVYYVGTQLDHKLHALWSRIWGMQGFFQRVQPGNGVSIEKDSA